MSITQSDIKDKIKKLREYWIDDEESLKFVASVEKRLRNMVLKEKLAESKAINEIVDEARGRIKAIDTLILNDEEMSEMTRRLLFRDKKVYQFFIDRLDGKDLDQQYEKVGQLLDTELKGSGLLKDDTGN